MTMNGETRETIDEMVQPDQAAGGHQPPRKPPPNTQGVNSEGDKEHEEGDRLSQPEGILIPNHDRRVEDNPLNEEPVILSIPTSNHESQSDNLDPRCFQTTMLAMLRRIENIDNRQTLQNQRFEELLKKKADASSSKDGEVNTGNGDQETEGTDHQKEAEITQGERPASSGDRSKRETPSKGRSQVRPSLSGSEPKTYLTQIHNNLFSDEIRRARFPEKLNLTEFGRYDGSQDPTTHVEDFGMMVVIRGIEEPITSRVFAATLKGPALKWLNTLPERSIHKFEDLAEIFEMHFATSKRQPKSQYTLSKIRQRPGELLQSYLDRFKLAALQVRGLSEEVHVHLLADGLDSNSRLAESFCKQRAKDLSDFISRSKKYLDLEQMRLANAPRRDLDRSTPPGGKPQFENRKRDRREKG